MTLVERLESRADQLVDDAAGALSQARLHHYVAAGEAVTRERLRALLDAVVESLDHGTPLSIVQHAEGVGQERFLAGFGIDEIQVAFNTLEEAVWRFLVATVPPEELSEDLGRLGAVLGAGKDRLAQTYVRLASHRHAPHVDVEALNRIV